MSNTFQALGLDFPLFEAPVSESAQYLGLDDCTQCGAVQTHTFIAEGKAACYACLRARKVSITKDTEFGMVTSEQADAGQTHGVPGLETDIFPVIETDDPEWQAAVIPSQHLWELVSTPSYSTWQGDRWLFCCKRPMIYIGPWSKDNFEQAAADGDAYGEAARMVATEEVDYWKGLYPDEMSFYVFRCPTCGKRRAHCDLD